MQRAFDMFYRLLEGVLVLLLFGMVLMVFGNVVLRYGFNSGILISAHLGIETLVQRFSRRGRLICMGASNIIVILCSVVFFCGAVMQFDINATMFAPVSGLSLAWVYGIGLFTGMGVFIIASIRLFNIVAGRTSDEDILRFVGEHQTLTERIE